MCVRFKKPHGSTKISSTQRGGQHHAAVLCALPSSGLLATVGQFSFVILKAVPNRYVPLERGGGRKARAVSQTRNNLGLCSGTTEKLPKKLKRNNFTELNETYNQRNKPYNCYQASNIFHSTRRKVERKPDCPHPPPPPVTQCIACFATFSLYRILFGSLRISEFSRMASRAE
jgi:hypothetical protein